LVSYYRPSLCGLRLYLRYHGEREAEPGPYDLVIRRLGEIHERSHLASFPEYLDLSPVSEQERLVRTREAVREHVGVIYQAGLEARVALKGGEAQVSGRPDFLIFQGGGYTIREAKMARRINDEDHPEILLQLQLYGWLFETAFDSAPRCLEVYSGAGEIVPVPYERNDVPSCLDLLSEIKLRNSEPYAAVGWTKCGACGFDRRCWTNAGERHDLALVVGIDQGLARALHEIGIHTRGELLARFDESSLSQFERPWGDRLQRVGKTAAKILRNAQVMERNQELLLCPPAIPGGPNYVMFDLEGIPPQLDELDKIYLWGMQVFGDSPSEYRPATAGFGVDGDREGWEAFLRNARSVLDNYGDVRFVHWSEYERGRLTRYVERFGDPDGTAAQVKKRLLNLLPITQSSIVLPLPSYSLKVIERYIGYKRALEEYGGDWSMARYIEATETRNDERRRQIMDQILAYNREDLEATWAVLQWLKSYPPLGA
jgi:predicted RecB family nuclease